MVVPAGRLSGPGTEEKGRPGELINQLVSEEEKCWPPRRPSIISRFRISRSYGISRDERNCLITIALSGNPPTFRRTNVEDTFFLPCRMYYLLTIWYGPWMSLFDFFLLWTLSGSVCHGTVVGDNKNGNERQSVADNKYYNLSQHYRIPSKLIFRGVASRKDNYNIRRKRHELRQVKRQIKFFLFSQDCIIIKKFLFHNNTFIYAVKIKFNLSTICIYKNSYQPSS